MSTTNPISNLQSVIAGTADTTSFTNAGFCGRVTESINSIGSFLKGTSKATMAIKQQTDAATVAAQNAVSAITEQNNMFNYWASQQDIALMDATKNLEVEAQYLQEIAETANIRVPSAPLGLAALAGRNRAILTWLPPSDPGYPLSTLSYSISYKLNSSSTSIPIMEYDPAANLYAAPVGTDVFCLPPKPLSNGRLVTFIYRLTNDVTYRFNVTASGVSGTSAVSADSPFVTPKQVTPPITNLVVYPGDKSITLNFMMPNLFYDSINYSITARTKTGTTVLAEFQTQLRMDPLVDGSSIYTDPNVFTALVNGATGSTFSYTTNSYLLNNLMNGSAYIISIQANGYDLEPFNPSAGGDQTNRSETVFTPSYIMPTDIPPSVSFLSSIRVDSNAGTSIQLTFQSPAYTSLSMTNSYFISVFGPNNDLTKVMSVSGFFPATNHDPCTTQKILIPPPAEPLLLGSYKCYVQGVIDNPIMGGEPILGERSQPTIVEI